MIKHIDQLKKLISEPKKIVITTHRGPDGDAMGSSLGLCGFLKGIGHKVNVITPNEYASFLHWVPGNEDVIVYEGNEKEADLITKYAEVIFLLDFNDLSRSSTFSHSLSNSFATKVMIDHHQNPDKTIADIFFTDVTASSTAQLVYEVIVAMEMKRNINKSIAECFYLGIMTDTGSFKYSSTNAKTHRIVAELIDLGVENTKIHDLIYDNLSVNRTKLLGYCLNKKLLLYPENNSAIISLDAKELEKFEFKKGDTEGFVNYALAVEGVRFAAFIAEKEGVVKLSLRSKGNIKVNEIASKYFSGGGHTNAAGGTSEISVNQTIKNLEKIIKNLK